MKIRLKKNEIVRYSNQYVGPNRDIINRDDALAKRLKAAVGRRHLTKADLIEVARWKWQGGRTRQLVSGNTEAEVRAISEVSFSTKIERLRIGALLALRGVQWPMASVILHFAFPKRYPILDVRAMNTVGGSTIYNFDKWMQYVKLCRNATQRFGVNMRTLDRALWQYDKEHGKQRTKPDAL